MKHIQITKEDFAGAYPHLNNLMNGHLFQQTWQDSGRKQSVTFFRSYKALEDIASREGIEYSDREILINKVAPYLKYNEIEGSVTVPRNQSYDGNQSGIQFYPGSGEVSIHLPDFVRAKAFGLAPKNCEVSWSSIGSTDSYYSIVFGEAITECGCVATMINSLVAKMNEDGIDHVKLAELHSDILELFGL